MTKKQLILDAAITLFSEKGIEATSVQQITEHCGISKGAFYLSFKSKEELVYSIIEHFLNNIIKGVDQAVNSEIDPSQKLHLYFEQTFKILSQYTGFAQILMKEKIKTISEELIERIQYFVNLSNENLAKLLIEIYGEEIREKLYDLIVVINGMVQAYLQIVFDGKLVMNQVDFSKLADTLVEKTTIIATHSQLIFLQQSDFTSNNEIPLTINQLTEELQRLKEVTVNQLEQESVALLIEELQASNPRAAIIFGLIHNLQNNNQFNWITLMIHKYFS
ncbi:TetR/AcrR family transcriptional regulator [Solibacillus daqui]|uniref:TetR/AcrR family transcriptional regulator n=1 Tax=Solibacillus daqui TaxID=2912187 RepID=UPI00236618C1|nr:TetR/AcrR family transcriptional regulator [Solibacillus daqui]